MAANLPFKKDQLPAVYERINEMLSEGCNAEEIAAMLGIENFKSYSALMASYYEHAGDELRKKPAEKQYLEYVHAQRENIEKLDRLVIQNESSTGTNLVQAIKARSEIIDKIVTRGQEMGFIAKQPDKKISEVRTYQNLPTPELRDFIIGEMKEIDLLLKKYGDVADAKPIIDVSVKSVYREEPEQKYLPSKPKEE